jgi:aspartokinase/homoserine dehydrogenase 1
MFPEIVVHKFGGAALADADAIRAVGELLVSNTAGGGRRAVVTSALLGVTNTLLQAIAHATARDAPRADAVVAELTKRHEDVAAALLSSGGRELEAIGKIIAEHGDALRTALRDILDAKNEAAASDAVQAYGERTAAAIVAAHLRERGVAASVVDGADVVATDARHGNAAPDPELTAVNAQRVVMPLLNAGEVVIIPGFIGRSPQGRVTTLGRGGSDLSAAVVARALGALEVVLWKDVPGFMTADPRVVPDARIVPVLDAREASELAYYGAKVLHPRTLLPLLPGTTLRLRPFADPAAQGTRVVVGRPARGAPVRALSGMGRQAMIAVNGTGMLGVPGVAARVFGALASQGISVSLISQASSEQSICFTVPSERAVQVVTMMRDEFAAELARGEIDEVTVRNTLVTIAVVGSGMANTPGIAARIFDAVAHADVNVVAIAQGASERNVSFVVDESQTGAAMRAVHDAFHLGKIGGGRAGNRTNHADVILLGAGRVARELMTQLSAIQRDRRTGVRVVGVIDRSGFVFRPRGFTARQLEELAQRKSRGEPLSALPGGKASTTTAAVVHAMSHALSRPVVVDLASGDTGEALAHAVEHGAHLVLANKVPLASTRASSEALLQTARSHGRRVLHEATVGAGLPVIDTLQQLAASGDRIDSVDCSPSGTMGFLFSEMGRGRSFSDAVRDAMERGYTEPDPRDDLCGLDVARKALILARMLGYSGEMHDVQVESLVPAALADVTASEFLEALPSVDEEWKARIDDARARGEVVRYRARATRGGVRVGLVSVPNTHPLASLDGTDNLFVFTTARYRTRPLVVSGPGAGAAVTAAGVLGDVLRLVGV